MKSSARVGKRTIGERGKYWYFVFEKINWDVKNGGAFNTIIVCSRRDGIHPIKRRE